MEINFKKDNRVCKPNVEGRWLGLNKLGFNGFSLGQFGNLKVRWAQINNKRFAKQGNGKPLPRSQSCEGRGEVIALLDITKCHYDAISSIEKAAKQRSAITTEVEGVEGQFEGNSSAPSAFVEKFREHMFTPSLSAINFYNSSVAIASASDPVHATAFIEMLRDGQLPLIGLVEKVERELARKFEHSKVSTKPNPFQLLYAFQIYRHNWRSAASYIYLYSVQLRAEAAIKDQTASLQMDEVMFYQYRVAKTRASVSKRGWDP